MKVQKNNLDIKVNNSSLEYISYVFMQFCTYRHFIFIILFLKINIYQATKSYKINIVLGLFINSQFINIYTHLR